MMSKAPTVVLMPLLVIGLISFVFVRTKQGDGDAVIARQQHAQALSPETLARLVKHAPDPVTRAAGLRAICKPLGRGVLLNPWRCSIDYASGRHIQYRLTLNRNGSYTGDHEILTYRGKTSPDTGVITGCCVVVP